jgi:hypothetical protein
VSQNTKPNIHFIAIKQYPTSISLPRGRCHHGDKNTNPSAPIPTSALITKAGWSKPCTYLSLLYAIASSEEGRGLSLRLTLLEIADLAYHGDERGTQVRRQRQLNLSDDGKVKVHALR